MTTGRINQVTEARDGEDPPLRPDTRRRLSARAADAPRTGRRSDSSRHGRWPEVTQNTERHLEPKRLPRGKRYLWGTRRRSEGRRSTATCDTSELSEGPNVLHREARSRRQRTILSNGTYLGDARDNKRALKTETPQKQTLGRVGRHCRGPERLPGKGRALLTAQGRRGDGTMQPRLR